MAVYTVKGIVLCRRAKRVIKDDAFIESINEYGAMDFRLKLRTIRAYDLDDLEHWLPKIISYKDNQYLTSFDLL